MAGPRFTVSKDTSDIAKRYFKEYGIYAVNDHVAKILLGYLHVYKNKIVFVRQHPDVEIQDGEMLKDPDGYHKNRLKKV